ncbi:MAG: glycosyltransferase [Clostridia bacterium]|nr:glycosyltransferase [Clostridia bacterium]
MKKILFVINHMNVGGIQKSLLELLKALVEEGEYDVSLFCCTQKGAYMERIPDAVHVLPENPYARVPEQALGTCRKQGKKYYLFRAFASLWSRMLGKAFPARLLCAKIGMLPGEYDVAISYSQPITDREFCNLTNEIVLKCCRAKKKATFVHCDFGSYGGNTRRNRRLYKKFDAIAAVSDSVGRRFAEIVPAVKDRVQTVYNCCDTKEILRMAEDAPVAYQKPTVVTVARLSPEKGLLRCVPLLARLRDEGVEFEWHVVGGGNLQRPLESAIEEHGMQGRIILEGEQTNPYRYVKNADYLLLASFHEAAPMVFDEAMTLSVPILTTNTLSAKELVAQRGVGMVCDGDDASLYTLLKDALTQKNEGLLSHTPSNAQCIAQFRALCADH